MQETLNKQVVIGISVAGVVGALGVHAYMSSRYKKNYERVGTVSKLYLHPVKSITAIEVQEGELTDKGFMSCGVYDRSFLVVDENGRFMSARKCTKMMLIKPSFSDDNKCLILSGEGHDDISIPLQQNVPDIRERVLGIDIKGQDCGDDVAKWLSDFLEGTYRMTVYRNGLPGEKLMPRTYRQNCWNFHLLSEASMEDLNSRMEEKLTEKNFRPNIYVKGCSPYAEDFWKYVKVGEKAEMIFSSYCGRCKLTTLNHAMGSFTESLDPLKTLKGYRQIYDFVENSKSYPKNGIMGTILNLETRGKVKVGDPVFASFQFQEHAGDAVKN